MVEIDGKFQQMEMSIVNLSKAIKDEQDSNSDSKQELKNLKEEMEHLEKHINNKYEKIVQDVEEINVKQNLILRRSDERAKCSDTKILDLKQMVLSLEQQLEAKEKTHLEKFEEGAATLLEKIENNEAVNLLSKNYIQLTE